MRSNRLRRCALFALLHMERKQPGQREPFHRWQSVNRANEDQLRERDRRKPRIDRNDRRKTFSPCRKKSRCISSPDQVVNMFRMLNEVSSRLLWGGGGGGAKRRGSRFPETAASVADRIDRRKSRLRLDRVAGGKVRIGRRACFRRRNRRRKSDAERFGILSDDRAFRARARPVEIAIDEPFTASASRCDRAIYVRS